MSQFHNTFCVNVENVLTVHANNDTIIIQKCFYFYFHFCPLLFVFNVSKLVSTSGITNKKLFKLIFLIPILKFPTCLVITWYTY